MCTFKLIKVSPIRTNFQNDFDQEYQSPREPVEQPKEPQKEPEYKNPHDPICVQSRTGYVILFSGVPIIFKSKLQTETTLSSIEAGYIVLSTMAMKEILPLRELIIEVCGSVVLELKEISTMHSTIWEDNSGCVVLANLEVPRMTPRSKHYAVQYHWFQDKLKPNNIKVEKLETDLQLANIFTKTLQTDKFEKLRKLLLGR